MNYENPTKYLTVALCWEATLCAFQRCPFKCPCVFYVPDNKENSTFQPDKEGGLLLYLREDRWVRHPLKELPLQENMILCLSICSANGEGTFCQVSGAGPQVSSCQALWLVPCWAGEFPLWPVEHQPRGESAFVASRHQCRVSPADPQKAPKSHYWYHDAIHTNHQEHQKLGDSHLRLLCGFEKITLSFRFSSPQLRWGVLARSVTFDPYPPNPAFQEISKKPLKRAQKAEHQGPLPSYNQLPHLFFFPFLYIECLCKIAFGENEKFLASKKKLESLEITGPDNLLFLTLKT